MPQVWLATLGSAGVFLYILIRWYEQKWVWLSQVEFSWAPCAPLGALATFGPVGVIFPPPSFGHWQSWLELGVYKGI